VDARVLSQVSPCAICGGQSGYWDRFCFAYYSFFLSVSFHHHLHAALAKRTNGRSLGTFQKNNALSEFGEHWIEKKLSFSLYRVNIYQV
jgi:hypothetical protein